MASQPVTQEGLEFAFIQNSAFKAAPTHFNTTARIGVMSVSHRRTQVSTADTKANLSSVRKQY